MTTTLAARQYDTITSPLPTVFTPPARCSKDWTYEAAFYNSIPGGLLIQDALEDYPNTDCFPDGWLGFGRAPSVAQIFSPGACPVGYSTAANTYNGAITTAVCCPTSFSYMVTYSSINYFSTSAQFVGCVSTYPGSAAQTTVLGRTNGTDLNTTTVTGPVTMWAQPISVAFQKADLSLFTTTSRSRSTSPTASPSMSATQSSASQTASQTTSTPVSSSSNTAQSSADKDDRTSSGLSGGTIAGIVIGAIVLLALVIGAAVFFSLRRKRDRPAAGAASDGPDKDATVWNGSQQYSSVPQYDVSNAPHELPSNENYGPQAVEKPADPAVRTYEMDSSRDPVELG